MLKTASNFGDCPNLVKNPNFPLKINILVNNSKFCSEFKFWSKIQIFGPKPKFWSKIRIPTIQFLLETFDFWPIFLFLTISLIFDQFGQLFDI